MSKDVIVYGPGNAPEFAVMKQQGQISVSYAVPVNRALLWGEDPGIHTVPVTSEESLHGLLESLDPSMHASIIITASET